MDYMDTINEKHLYRIGTGWVYEVSTNLGYKVIRSDDQKKTKNNIIKFEPCFKVLLIQGELRIEADEEIPVGIIRKAFNLYELYAKGELKEHNAKHS